jgi:hypothetical protein
MKRREFITLLGAGLPSIADPALAALQPLTPRALIAGLNTRASAEGGKSLPWPGSAQPNRSP